MVDLAHVQTSPLITQCRMIENSVAVGARGSKDEMEFPEVG